MILFNDASLHGQFMSFPEFLPPLKELQIIKKLLEDKRLCLHVCRTIHNRKITAQQTLGDFINERSVSYDWRMFLRLWIDRNGPFWDGDGEEQRHCFDEWFECNDDPITGSGLAEAAFKNLQYDTNDSVVSISPSSFCATPLSVIWRQGDSGENAITVLIDNGYDRSSVCSLLQRQIKEPASWDDFIDWMARFCPNLTFSKENILNQIGLSFIPNVARRSMELLGILNRMAEMQILNSDEFIRMVENFIHGGALFSPSSESDKNRFSGEMTFEHPDTKEKTLCHYHGKIRAPQYRIHFDWPPRNGKIFIAYIGPKITKH